MARIVTTHYRYKRPPKKKLPAPAIAQAVVTARRTDAKSKAAPTETAKKSAIVSSISRKEAEFLQHARGAEHDVEERDDDTDEALTARYRSLIARKLRGEKSAEEIESRPATSKPQRKSAIVIKKQRADALAITPTEMQRRVDAADALFRDVVRRDNAPAKQRRSSSPDTRMKK